MPPLARRPSIRRRVCRLSRRDPNPIVCRVHHGIETLEPGEAIDEHQGGACDSVVLCSDMQVDVVM